MSQALRDAVATLLSLHDTKQHTYPHEQAAWTALREALAVPGAEFAAMGTGVTELREVAAQLAAHDSRVCSECGQVKRRERTGRVL